jgi:cell division protein FtsQ
MQQLWTKRWKLIGSLVAGIVAIVLLVSAVHTNNAKVCSGINVEIYSPSNNFFVSDKEVKEVINTGEDVEGTPIEKLNLQTLEDRLRKDKWIEKAELFFDKNHVLQVRVEEKEPVARIFTPMGTSYYIDSSCRHLPLSNTLSARVPMFTNFPSDRNRLSRRDSALMATVKDLAVFIQGDEFWKAMVAQVDVTQNGFEMIPTIGNHVVVLGKGEDIPQKFDRLYTFYKQVWTKVGLNAFAKIDVQYKGQVVVTRKGAAATRIDSTQARVAVQTLLADMKSKQASADPSGGGEKDVTRTATTVSASASFVEKKEEAKEKKEDVKQANDVKKKEEVKTVEQVKKAVDTKSNIQKKQEKRVPKAVMGRTN